MPLFPSRRKGLGYREDPVDKRDHGLEKLGLGDSHLSLRYSMRADVPTILDQKATSSCVAHTFVAAVHLLEARAGHSYNPVSRLFAYYNARRMYRPRGLLTDSGTYLRTCAKGMQRLGIPDEIHWPFSAFTLKINRRPSFAAQMRAHPRMGGLYVRILESGDERIKALKAAVSAGYPVGFGISVSDDIFDVGSDTIQKPALSDPIVGGHAMLIIGYDDNDGECTFEIQNSWGTSWGDDGFGWISEEYIRWRQARDFQIIYGWRRAEIVA
jgi:hypothetical protein